MLPCLSMLAVGNPLRAGCAAALGGFLLVACVCTPGICAEGRRLKGQLALWHTLHEQASFKEPVEQKQHMRLLASLTHMPSLSVCSSVQDSGTCCAGIHVEGGDREAVSPVVHVRLTEQPTDVVEAEEVLQQVVDTALRKSGVLMAVNRLSKLDAVKSAPSIR